jgi:hypothetical protein
MGGRKLKLNAKEAREMFGTLYARLGEEGMIESDEDNNQYLYYYPEEFEDEEDQQQDLVATLTFAGELFITEVGEELL